MTRTFLRGHRAAALLCLSLPLTLGLVACGGSSDSNKQSTLRLVNATTDVPAINLALGGTNQTSGIAIDAMGASSGFTAGTYDTVLTSGSGTTALFSTSRAYSESTDYTFVAWGSASALKLSTLSDTADAASIPASGSAAVRLFNTTTDAGAVDLYLTAATTDLDSASAVIANLAAGSLTSYTTVTPGTYRLRVTGAGDKTDIRLDKTDVVIGNQARSSFVLEQGVGGVLLHALQFDYQSSALTARKNTEARVRLASSVDGNGAVTAAVAGTSVNVGLRSPSVGGYVRVPAGTAQALAVSVAGLAQADTTRAVAAGGDYTLLVSGATASPLITLIADDNRLPSSATRAKVRLVNGAAGKDGLTLAVDYNALATGVGYGTASTAASVTANSAAAVEVSSPLLAAPLYSTATSTVNLQAQGVYSVFMLGGNATPTGVLRKDR